MTHHQQTVYPRLSKTSPFTIVLLNGWGMTAGTWGSLIPVLQKEHDVVVVDVVYSEDVDTLCDTIYSELPERCVLIGWSLGGMLATKITAMYPRSIVGLITLSSNAQFVADSDWPHAMPADTFEAFFQLWTTTPEKSLQRFSSLVIQGDKQRREQKKYLQSFNNTNARMEAPVELKAGLILLREIKNKTSLENIHCPNLHFFGENDALVPINTIDAIRQLNSQLECQTISDTSHLLHAPVDRIEKTIMPFLENISVHKSEVL